MVKFMGVGLALGRRLDLDEKPRDVTEEHIKAIKEKGFGHVRLLVHCGSHTGNLPPYEIEKDWLVKVEGVVNMCIKNDLFVVLSLSNETWMSSKDR